MNGWKWLVQQFLQMPKWERVGNIILLSAIFIVTLSVYFWPAKPMTELEIAEADQAVQQLDSIQSSIPKKSFAKDSTQQPLLKSNAVINDIHKATKDDLVAIGLDKKTAATLLKYMEKGGKVKHADDLDKIYGMTPEKKSLIVKKCSLDTTVIEKKASGNLFVAELNTSDSVALTSVKGIGNKLAGRIINYRKKLGGFHSIEQLLEVYGMKQENFETIKPQVTIKNSFSPSIKINSITAKELKKHPYFWKTNAAEALVAYRDKHGKYTTPNDLKKCALVSDELLAKISPYLIFD